MKTAVVHITGVAPISTSRAHQTDKLEGESADAFEKRTWPEKSHYDSEGNVFIPPMAFKQALDKAASRLGIKIVGKGNATYTKHFLAGVMCMEPFPLGVKKDEIKGDWVYCNADGVRGSGTRVWRCFPTLPAGWGGPVRYVVLDDVITKEIFEKTVRESGSFVGLGRFRPERGGFYGRFTVDRIDWE